MFGKLMRVPDEAMPVYYSLLLDEEPQADPREAKRHMAYALTARYHGEEAAEAARERFDTLHVRRELPDEIDEFRLLGGEREVHVPALLADAFGLSSRRAAPDRPGRREAGGRRARRSSTCPRAGSTGRCSRSAGADSRNFASAAESGPLRSAIFLRRASARWRPHP